MSEDLFEGARVIYSGIHSRSSYDGKCGTIYRVNATTSIVRWDINPELLVSHYTKNLRLVEEDVGDLEDDF